MQGLAGAVALILFVVGETPLWVIAVMAALYLGMTGVVLGNAMAGFMSFFPTVAGMTSAFAGAIRCGCPDGDAGEPDTRR